MENRLIKLRIFFKIKSVNKLWFFLVVYMLGYKAEKCDGKEISVILNKCCRYGQVLDNFQCVSDFNEQSNSSKWKISSNEVLVKDHKLRTSSSRATIKTSRAKIHRPQNCKIYHLKGNQLPVNVNLEGQLKLRDEEGKLTFIKKENFCIDWTLDRSYIVEVCKSECNKDSFCVRKCCLPHEVIDVETFECVSVKDDNQRWVPFVYEMNASEAQINLTASGNEIDLEMVQSPIIVPGSRIAKRFLKIGTPSCSNGTQYDISFKEKNFYLLTSGELAVDRGDGRFRILKQNEFCVDGALSVVEQENVMYRIAKSLIVIPETRANISLINSLKSFLESHQYAFVCFPDGDEEADDGVLESKLLSDQLAILILPWNWRFSVFPSFKLISSFFLLVTIVVYLILWKDHGLPGWLQFSYTVSLFIAFTFLAVVQLWTQEVYTFSIHLCRALGYSILASFLSVFFWLTCMNIDLYLIFRASPMKTNLGKRKGKRKFLCFALICLGIPTAITIAAIAIDWEYRQNPETQSILPRSKIGEDACTLNLYDKMAQLYYFYFPVGTLLVVNLIFFFCTAACLRERQKETKVANCNSTAGDYDRERFKLFTRLFFVMGVLWIFELISWIAEMMQVDEKISRLFVVTDILNSLQGVAVFVMFVWKPNTRRQLKQKFLRAFWKQGIFKRNSTQKSNTLY